LVLAALIRVSTDRQAEQGESLRTQRRQIERDASRIGGTIAKWYGGVEHATPGWEKQQVDRLLADAGRGIWDAVMVAYADRWSRDNARSKDGLEVLRRHRVRFYVGAAEMDLFDPQVRFILGVHAEVGEFIAAQTARKSIECRIERASRGVPTSGKLPFGRTWDGKAWGVNEAAQQMIADIAHRYLAGESLTRLCKEYGVNHANTCKVLRERCGEEWVQEFKAPALNVHEVVLTKVPRLLPDSTIKAVRQRLEANRTYLHKPPRSVHDYLLSGFIFCAGCGYSLTGQATAKGERYYRHAVTPRERQCTLPAPRPWVRADDIERAVVRDLFKMVGNPAAIERAIRSAVPDSDEALRRRAKLADDLTGIERARERLLSLVTSGACSVVQAQGQLGTLQEREDLLRAELNSSSSKGKRCLRRA
jgi:DNA invertase Pin-like site-specific DNA recombinase